MNNEDMSEMIQKLSSMLNDSNNQENSNSENKIENDVSSNSNNINEDTIQNILNNLNFNNNNNNCDAENNNENSNNNFNFDINTMLKMKNIMDKMNSNKNDPRANLLLSLKPYLNNTRQEKLDQYMQFLNITKVLEAFNSNGGDNNK